jgi:hypothetical protein
VLQPRCIAVGRRSAACALAVLAASSSVFLTCESLHLVSVFNAFGNRFRHDSDRTRAVSCKRGAERSQG